MRTGRTSSPPTEMHSHGARDRVARAKLAQRIPLFLGRNQPWEITLTIPHLSAFVTKCIIDVRCQVVKTTCGNELGSQRLAELVNFFIVRWAIVEIVDDTESRLADIP